MSAHHHDQMAPPGAVRLAALLVLAAFLLVVAVRAGLLAPSPSAAMQRAETGVVPVESRLLRFADQPDGRVRIEDAASGRVVALIGRDGGGFIRGVMRGLARERRMHNVDARPPFNLILWQSGALSLTDTATGRVIELGGFGPDNRAAFLRLLRAGGSA